MAKKLAELKAFVVDCVGGGILQTIFLVIMGLILFFVVPWFFIKLGILILSVLGIW